MKGLRVVVGVPGDLRRGRVQAETDKQTLLSRVAARGMGWGIATFARLLTAVQPEWRGIEPASDKRRIYYVNHVSHGDFVLLWSVLPVRERYSTRPVAGADYWRRDRLRRFIGERVFNSVLIERTPQGRNGTDPIAQMAEALDGGASLIIFPEGTRNLGDEALLAFKSGIVRVAQARPGVELVPVWIDNLNRVLPKGALIPVPLMCKVIFGAPLQLASDEDKTAFLDRAREALLALRPRTERE